MSPDKKAPSLAIMLGVGHPDDEHEDGEAPDMEGAKKDAASALIDAVHAKDADAVLEAFDTLSQLCAHEEEEEDGAEEDDEKPSLLRMASRG